MGLWSKLFGLDSVVVPRKSQTPSLDAVLATDYDKEMAKLNKRLAKQDKQLAAAQKAEAEYKETKDADKLVEFWEEMTKEGIVLNGVGWPFKLTDAYYRAKRYDDAWRELSKLVLKPDTRRKARQWQIRILKKEKKDYSHIQHLLDNDQ